MPSDGTPGMREFIAVAERRETCLPAFDVGWGHPSFVGGVFAACRELDAPALFLCWAGFGGEGGFRPVSALVRAMSEEYGVPALLHLDHSTDEERVRSAVDAGFGSVMFDGGDLEFEENIRRTREVVEYAHGRGVLVEGELGSLAREHSGKGRQELTDPDLAAEFVRRSGVDILTPSVGNRHGCAGFTVPLDWDLIRELHESVGVPMALHGGSGVALEDAVRAGKYGFRKLNLATALFNAYNGSVKREIQGKPGAGWMRWLAAGREAIAEIAKKYIRALGLEGAAAEIRPGG